MPKTKFRFNSPTVLRGDAPFLGTTVQQWDDAFTGNMNKALAKVKKLAESAAERQRLATIVDDQLRAQGRPSVRFVDDPRTGPMPMFVTRTTLRDLLVDGEIPDVSDDQEGDVGPSR
jgi:hypothetical protein